MRLMVDASPLLLRSAGVKNYLFHWIDHLERLQGGNELRLFPFMPARRTLDHERSSLSFAATAPRIATLLFCNIRRNPAINWLVKGADIFHATNQVRQPVRGVGLTATIHDMTCWLMPEVHRAANVRADKSYAERVLQRADGLIAVSENTRQDAIRLLGLDPDRVVTIHSGVAPAFFEVSEETARETASRYGLRKPYVLYTGTIEPRKNVDGLLDAFSLLPPLLREEFDLVMAGPIGWASEETVARLRNPHPGVRYLGYVPEKDLPAITRGATVFAYPSLYEGFGFPVAQAMACGVAVVTSRNSCLPEIAGQGGLCVDPRSPEEISSALERLLSSPDNRSGMGMAGREIATRDYRWEIAARKSWKFFERIYAGAKPNQGLDA